MPHTAVRIHCSRIRNDFGNGKVGIVSVAYAYCNAAKSSKCSMNLPKSNYLRYFLKEFLSYLFYYVYLFERKEEGKGGRLTAFCPRTVHRIPSDAFARHARIMYVGSMYFTSMGTPISLKYFFVWQKHSKLLPMTHRFI